MPSKTSLDRAEREEITNLLKDDIWFYQEAVKEYDRRISDQRLQAVFDQVLPLVRSCGVAMARVIAMLILRIQLGARSTVCDNIGSA